MGLALDRFTNHYPSVLWHCWLGHVTHIIVSEMTYNVSSGTLNPTIPYHTIPLEIVGFTKEKDQNVPRQSLIAPLHFGQGQRSRSRTRKMPKSFFLPLDAMYSAPRGLCCRKMSVCPSVRHTPLYSVETAKYILRLFFRVGTCTILVFPYQTVSWYGNIPMRPPNRCR